MIEITINHVLTITGLLAGSTVSLVIYIYKIQSKRITKVETVQEECPINRVYTMLEMLKTDITWIKKAIQETK